MTTVWDEQRTKAIWGEGEQARVLAWRSQEIERLCGAKFVSVPTTSDVVYDVHQLAESDLDIHDLERLLSAGCTPENALAILL